MPLGPGTPMGPTGPQFTLVDPVSSNVASREIHERNGVLIATSSINDGFSIDHGFPLR